MPPIIELLVVVLIVGVILWGIEQFPIDPTIKNFLRVAIIVIVAIYIILFVAGMFGAGPGTSFRWPHG